MKKNIIIFISGIIFAAVMGVVLLKAGSLSKGFIAKAYGKIVDIRFNRVPKATAPLAICDFETQADYKMWQKINADLIFSKNNVTSGSLSGKVTYKPGSQVASLKLEQYFEKKGAITNWSGFEGLVFDVYNPQATQERIILQIKDKKGYKVKMDLSIEGNSKETFEIEITSLRHTIDIYNIAEFSLFLWEPKQEKSFYIDRLILVPYGGKDKKTILLDSLIEKPEVAWATGDYFDFSKNKQKWVKQDSQGNTFVGFGAYLDNESNLDWKNLPFTSGIPFPRGELKEGDNLEIVDSQGNPFVFQSRPLCRWLDGSIKWLQVDLESDLKSVSRQNLQLRYPKVSQAKAPETKLSLAEDNDKIIVNTGKIKFILKKRNFNLFDSLWLDNNADNAFSDDELVTQNNDLTLWFGGKAYHASKDANSQVKVEEKGPVKVTIKAEGWFVSDKGKKFCKYVVRVQAFNDSGIVRVFHTFIYTGYPENKYHYLYKGKRLPKNETIEAVTLDMPLSLAGEGIFSFAADNQVVQGKWDKDTEFFQSNFDAFSIEKESKLIKSGKQMDGWLDVSNDRLGLSVGVKNFWQQYPKGVYLDNKNKKLELSLWPKRAGALDLKTTAEAYGTEAVARGSAFGLAKTHEVVFYFHNGNFKQAQARNTIAGMLSPLLIKVQPEWTQDTVALGKLLAYDAQRFGSAENMFDDLFDWADRQIKDFHWYGMIDFGDTLSWYRKDGYEDDDAHDDWGWHPVGRWGWFNCEGVGTHTGVLLQYMRSGNTKYFNFGENLTRHIMDIDTCHYNTVANDPRLKKRIYDDYSRPGSMHRHNANHWGDRNEEASHTSLTGILYYYYITGNERAFDVAKEVGEFFLEGRVTYFQHPDIAPERSISNILWGATLMYEATGDKRYKEAADKWADLLCRGQHNNGSWAQNYNPVEKRWDGDPNGMFTIDYTAPALIEYHKLTRNAAVKEAILRVTKYMMKDAYELPMDSMAYSLWLTGDKKFQDGGAEKLDFLIGHQNHTDDPITNGMIYQKAYYNRPDEYLYRTPFILEALSVELPKTKAE